MQIAFSHRHGDTPGILFCGGFKSDMQGNKARFLEQLCESRGWQFTRFDYRGHGQSAGAFIDCNLDHWVEDTVAVLEQVCSGPQIIVGSSMGAWIAIRATLEKPQRIAALVGIAAAPDFTEKLIWQALSEAEKRALQQGKHWQMQSNSDAEQKYVITMELINSGRRHAVLGKPIALHCPVRLLHGTADTDVPHALSAELLSCVESSDAQLCLRKQADHRFSDHACLRLTEQTLLELRELVFTHTAVHSESD